MNSKNVKTLKEVFYNPVKPDIKWNDIERLLKSCGAEFSEGSGSRVRVYLNGIRAVFHRPHPKNITDKGAVISVRRFLTEAGIKP